MAGLRQVAQILVVAIPMTTYEGIDDGDSNSRLDSERLRRLGHNSSGFSRASFVANKRRRCIQENYMIGVVLGRGATATVYESLNYKTCQKVAVKAIQKKFVRDERHWLNEIQIHRAVDHPNIVRLLDTFEDDNMVYLVTELCQGGDLRDHIHADVPDDGALAMPEKEVLQLFQSMVCSVHYLHQRGIVHRDIKPGNFLCDAPPIGLPAADGACASMAKRPIVKLADFGVSAYCGDQKHRLTKSVGSDGYIAPEVIRRQPYTEKADIFSLGCILHAMLTGSPPQSIDGAHGQPYLIVNEIGLRAASEDMYRLVKSLMQPRPEDRPSAEALLQLPLLRSVGPKVTEAAKPSSDELLDRMYAYSFFPVLKKAAITAMISEAETLSDFTDLTDKFMSGWFPLQCSGHLEEQMAMPPQAMLGLSGCRLHHMGRCKSRSQSLCRRGQMRREIEGLFSQIDGSGEISYTEWLAATVDPSWYMDSDRIAVAFRLFDHDGDGLISASDLEQVLPEMFEILPRDVILKNTELPESPTSYIDEETFSMLIRSTASETN